METLVMGLTVVSVLFFTIFFAWAYWPAQWVIDQTRQRRQDRTFRLRKALEPVLRRLTRHAGHEAEPENTEKAA